MSKLLSDCHNAEVCAETSFKTPLYLCSECRCLCSVHSPTPTAEEPERPMTPNEQAALDAFAWKELKGEPTPDTPTPEPSLASFMGFINANCPEWLAARVEEFCVEQRNAALARVGALDREHGCSMGVGDGSGQLFVYGTHEAIKAAQAIVLRMEAATSRADALEMERDEQQEKRHQANARALQFEKQRDALAAQLAVAVPVLEKQVAECDRRMAQVERMRTNGIELDELVVGLLDVPAESMRQALLQIAALTPPTAAALGPATDGRG